MLTPYYCAITNRLSSSLCTLLFLFSCFGHACNLFIPSQWDIHDHISIFAGRFCGCCLLLRNVLQGALGEAAFMNGRNKELVEIAEKVSKKLKRKVEEKGF